MMFYSILALSKKIVQLQQLLNAHSMIHGNNLAKLSPNFVKPISSISKQWQQLLRCYTVNSGT